MSDLNKLYAYHIDELRRNSKIRVADFCNGICSDRQYRRYISGDQTISQKNINLFCEKLGLQPSDFYNSFYRQDNNEYQKVLKLYNCINANEYEKSELIFKELRNYKFLNVQTNRWFDYCQIRHNHLVNKISKYTTFDLYSEIIDYPSCLSKKMFDFVDIVIILKIANIEYELDKEVALKYLYNLLFDRNFIYVSSNSRHVLPSIYADVARIFGMKNRIEECLAISSKGIEYSLIINDLYVLSKLYYYKALSLFKLGKVNDSLFEARKCISATIAQDNKIDLELYTRLIKKDLKINPMDLFLPGFIKL